MVSQIPSWTRIELSGVYVTMSGDNRLRVGQDLVLYVRDSGNLGGSNLTGTFNFIYLSGQTITADINSIYLNGVPISGGGGGVSPSQLQSTGAQAYAMVTGLSGYDQTYYATLTNLTLSGQTLYADIVGLSGWVSSLVESTGQQAWTTAQNNAINLSGQLTQTGAQLYQDLVNASGLFVYTGNELTFYTGLQSGFDSYWVDFLGHVFSSVPRVFAQFEPGNFSNVVYAVTPSGRTISGTYLNFTDVLTETGAGVNILAKI